MKKQRAFPGIKELFLNKKSCGPSSWNSELRDASWSRGPSWTEQWQAARTSQSRTLRPLRWPGARQGGSMRGRGGRRGSWRC
jgi:hypothetical protein